MDATGWSHQTLAALADTVAASPDLRHAARRLCELVARSGAADRVGLIALEAPERFAALGASDEPAEAVASWQAAHGQGPSADACRLGEPVLVPRLEGHWGQRWPGYTPRAVAAGVRSLWAVPLVAGNRCAGAMEGHRVRAGPIDAATVRNLSGLGTFVGVLLVNWQEHGRAARQADALQAALRQRIVVEQAKGRLAERHQIPVEAAFALLSGYARAHGLHLHEVAAQVVAGQLRL